MPEPRPPLFYGLRLEEPSRSPQNLVMPERRRPERPVQGDLERFVEHLDV